jgi:arginine deiminase
MTERLIKEREPQSIELGVYEETAEAKMLMMWGKPGAETVLGQLLPSSVGCFEKSFDVPKAREELTNARQLIEKKGVNVFVVKDEWARMIDDTGAKTDKSMDELKSEIIERGIYLYEKYADQREKENEEERQASLSEGRDQEEPAGLEVLDWLDQLLDADVKEYGENAAVIMNERLSLIGYMDEEKDEHLPLSNIFFARDQSNLIGKTWIWSSMKHDIRKAEVPIYKDVVRHSGLLDNQVVTEVEVEGVGFFEGGDGIVNSGCAYIGIGGRTNLEGVKQAARSILQDGLRLIVVRDKDRAKDNKNEMDAMHLDTFWMPTEENEAVGCMDEIKERKAFEAYMDKGDQVKFKLLGSFADHLAAREMNMIPLTKEEQEKYAPNFLNIRRKEIILSLADGNNLTDELTKRGKTVENADLQEVTKGYGGLHCATATIARY